MPETVSSFPGLYTIGAGQGVTLVNGGGFNSAILNARDYYTPGASDFVLLGPGSQVWILGYSIRASRPFPFPAPANPLGLELVVEGSYEAVSVFFFQTEQTIILPVYQNQNHFAGRARVESPAARFSLLNNTGDDLVVSHQFWGKAL